MLFLHWVAQPPARTAWYRVYIFKDPFCSRTYTSGGLSADCFCTSSQLCQNKTLSAGIRPDSKKINHFNSNGCLIKLLKGEVAWLNYQRDFYHSYLGSWQPLRGYEWMGQNFGQLINPLDAFCFFPLYDATDLHCEMDEYTIIYPHGHPQSFDHGTCIIQNMSGGDGLIYPWLPRWSQAMLGQASAPPVGMQAQETRWASPLRFKPFLKESCLPTPMAGSGSMFFLSFAWEDTNLTYF